LATDALVEFDGVAPEDGAVDRDLIRRASGKYVVACLATQMIEGLSERLPSRFGVGVRPKQRQECLATHEPVRPFGRYVREHR
jgi:hypothetical protein